MPGSGTSMTESSSTLNFLSTTSASELRLPGSFMICLRNDFWAHSSLSSESSESESESLSELSLGGVLSVFGDRRKMACAVKIRHAGLLAYGGCHDVEAGHAIYIYQCPTAPWYQATQLTTILHDASQSLTASRLTTALLILSPCFLQASTTSSSRDLLNGCRRA